MKILFETNRAKIKNTQALDKALDLIQNKSKQGFFRSKGESNFRKYNENSILEDAKLIELHIVKDEGKGEYKFNGNLSYNQNSKEVKFYILSVIEFNDFRYDDIKMAGFINKPNNSEDEDINELREVIRKIKKTKPAFVPYKKTYQQKRTPNPKRMQKSDSAQAKTNKNKERKNFKTDSRRSVSNNKKASF